MIIHRKKKTQTMVVFVIFPMVQLKLESWEFFKVSFSYNVPIFLPTTVVDFSCASSVNSSDFPNVTILIAHYMWRMLCGCVEG
jgi:hypothetical protein